MKITERLGRYTSMFSRKEWSEFSASRPESNKLYLKFRMYMRLIISTPAFVYHEMCHMAAMAILGLDFTVQEFKVFKYIKPAKKLNLYTLTIKIKDTANRRKSVWIVSISPLIGYVLGLVVMIWTAAFHAGMNYYGYAILDLCIAWYMTRYYKSFSLSEVDRNTFFQQVKQIRIQRHVNRKRKARGGKVVSDEIDTV